MLENSYSIANDNSNLNSTYDDLLEEKKRLLENKSNPVEESNLFKTRIIESEINSVLRFQMILYFHYFFIYLMFAIQIATSVQRYNVMFIKGKVPILRIIITVVYFFEENIRIYFGYVGNLGESVK
jgi:hypothetical protein